MNTFFYDIFLAMYRVSVRLFALVNPKARAWVSGRKNSFQQLSNALQTSEKVVWMHCASLGEFEQGQPLLQQLKSTIPPNYTLLLTFFSPSGYEAKKNYDGVDHVFYLPMDSRKNAAQFFDVVKPHLILFVKYEFWYYYIAEAKKRAVPLLLVSGIFRPGQPFFRWFGGLHRYMLSCFTYFFLQNASSVALIQKLGYANSMVSGDTRFDRVLALSRDVQPIPLIAAFCGSAEVVVAGSTWVDDDKELDHFANTQPHLRFIVAPHNVGAHRIQECLYLYKHAITYSQLQREQGIVPAAVNTLIIDNVGMLSRLYSIATVAYVGGGFGGDGVHNILEPAVFGKPVVFGPEFEKFAEAIDLVERGGAFSVTNALELEKTLLGLLDRGSTYNEASLQSKTYVQEMGGATEKIIDFIQAKRLLTN